MSMCNGCKEAADEAPVPGQEALHRIHGHPCEYPHTCTCQHRMPTRKEVAE